MERQQLKWFVYAVALFALVFPPSILVFGDGRLIALLLPLVPAAAGIAILRYRLYDIDVIVNRTLVYGSLTVMLGLVYFGSVVSLQYVFRAFTGGLRSVCEIDSPRVWISRPGRWISRTRARSSRRQSHGQGAGDRG